MNNFTSPRDRRSVCAIQILQVGILDGLDRFVALACASLPSDFSCGTERIATSFIADNTASNLPLTMH
jgi:hypothetical protein